MRAKRIFCLVAYDISLAKRRNKLVKLLEPYGSRINRSVYECLFTDAQFRRIQKQMAMIVSAGTDQVAIYPICVSCYARSVYIPAIKNDFKVVGLFD